MHTPNFRKLANFWSSFQRLPGIAEERLFGEAIFCGFRIFEPHGEHLTHEAPL